MPQRIRMTRRHPWRAYHPHAVRVARPTVWGNPFTVGRPVPAEYGTAPVRTRIDAVTCYGLHLRRNPHLIDRARTELAARDLACWCPLPAPGEPDWCHAAVLLAVANPHLLPPPEAADPVAIAADVRNLVKEWAS